MPEIIERSKPLAFGASALIGTLGGLIGLGGAELKQSAIAVDLGGLARRLVTGHYWTFAFAFADLPLPPRGPRAASFTSRRRVSTIFLVCA